MSDRFKEAADDVFFNIIMLKKKILMTDLLCVNCKKPAKDWVTISICHHIICEKCINVATNSNLKPCPKCSVLYRSKDIKHSNTIKTVFAEMEDFVWDVHANMYGVLEDNFYAERVEESNMMSIEPNTSLYEDSSHQIEPTKKSTSLNNSLVGAPKNKKSKRGEHSNGFAFASEKELAKPTSTVAKKYKKLSSNISGVSSISHRPKKNVGITPLTEENSIDNNINRTLDLNSVLGRPLQNAFSSNNCLCTMEPNKMIVTYSHMCPFDVIQLKNWASIYGIKVVNVDSNWNDNITHLIVKTKADSVCLRTLKFMNALLSNCLIISFEWVTDSKKKGELQPEINYMVKDSSGINSPLIVWRVNRGIINSPMIWAQQTILYFHKSTKFDIGYSRAPIWARKCGFNIASEITEFKNSNLKMRIILCDIPESKDIQCGIPNNEEVIEWLMEYKTISIYIDWFLECLFRFKFICFEPQYQVMKLNKNLIENIDIGESLFVFQD